jgi:hypothetical protein
MPVRQGVLYPEPGVPGEHIGFRDGFFTAFSISICNFLKVGRSFVVAVFFSLGIYDVRRREPDFRDSDNLCVACFRQARTCQVVDCRLGT